MNNARGFSLLEVLLATALLAAGLALAFATVRSAMAVGQRSEAQVQASEQMRGVLDVLRSRLQSALPLPYAEGEQGQLPPRFDGAGDGMHFVSEVPAYVGVGGPYLHALSVRRSTDRPGMELVLALSPVQAGAALPGRPAQVIAADLDAVSFRYRGLDPDTGQLGEWQPDWPWLRHQRGPLLVAITVSPRVGQAWPELIVNLPPVVR